MKPEQAIEILTRAVAQYRGTLEEHQTIQKALQTLRETVGKSKAKKK